MDGIHDLGGREGFGPVLPETDEPAFHAHWEAAVFAMVGASAQAGAMLNSDQFRHAVERIEPRAYLDHGYYGRWLGAIETLFVEAGLLTRAEIDDAARVHGAGPDDLVAARPNDAPDAVAYPALDANAQRHLDAVPRFQVGDGVRSATHGVPGHTRLPAYVRGHLGTIVTCHGGWVYPDSNAHGRGEAPAHLYTVSFSGAELWGPDAEPGMKLNIDLFEPYLEPAVTSEERS